MNLISFRDFLKLFRVVYLASEGVSLQDGMFQSQRKLACSCPPKRELIPYKGIEDRVRMPRETALLTAQP